MFLSALLKLLLFQSTPSQEGEPTPLRSIAGAETISIHSLARGRTKDGAFIITGNNISIHSLARGRTFERWAELWLENISIHSLARGRTQKRLTEALAVAFQSTPSQEGERGNIIRSNRRSNFNPLPRKRENNLANQMSSCCCISIHSLARGRTKGGIGIADECVISIHSLARGRTSAKKAL